MNYERLAAIVFLEPVCPPLSLNKVANDPLNLNAVEAILRTLIKVTESEQNKVMFRARTHQKHSNPRKM